MRSMTDGLPFWDRIKVSIPALQPGVYGQIGLDGRPALASVSQYPDATGKRVKFASLCRLVHDTFGAVPAGWHVHHIDHNPWNNEPDNLVALRPVDHLEWHRICRMAKICRMSCRREWVAAVQELYSGLSFDISDAIWRRMVAQLPVWLAQRYGVATSVEQRALDDAAAAREAVRVLLSRGKICREAIQGIVFAMEPGAFSVCMCAACRATQPMRAGFADPAPSRQGQGITRPKKIALSAF